MSDTVFDEKFEPSNYSDGCVNVVVEIPFASTDKIEWNPKLRSFEIDRVESLDFPEPVNYGFIPKTIGGDGDNLDAIIVTESPIATGTIVKSRVIGVMKFIDEGEIDDKIVAVPIGSSDLGHTVDNLPDQKIKEIEHHFNNYKNYKKLGSTSVLGWGGLAEAKKIIEESMRRWKL